MPSEDLKKILKSQKKATVAAAIRGDPLVMEMLLAADAHVDATNSKLGHEVVCLCLDSQNAPISVELGQMAGMVWALLLLPLTWDTAMCWHSFLAQGRWAA